MSYKYTLSPNIKDKYEPSAIVQSPKLDIHGFGQIDFRTITLDLAQKISVHPIARKYIVAIGKEENKVLNDKIKSNPKKT